MRAELPLTIVIATWNRCDDLAMTLAGLETLEPVGEILVIDNASTDGTTEMVRQLFPAVNIHRQEVNSGVPAFNIGVLAPPPLDLLLLDDYSIPAPGCLTAAVTIMNAERQIALLACHIVDDAGHAVTDNWPPNPLCFWGCGALVRRALAATDAYFFDPRLRLHGTEMDLCIRLRARGCTVRYAPDCVVHHRVSLANRSKSDRIRALVPSALWFPLKHLPTRFAVPATARHLVLLGWRSIRTGVPRAYIAGLEDAVRELPVVWKERRIVPARVARAYYRGVWEYEPLVRRVLRSLFGWPVARSVGPFDFGESV